MFLRDIMVQQEQSVPRKAVVKPVQPTVLSTAERQLKTLERKTRRLVRRKAQQSIVQFTTFIASAEPEFLLTAAPEVTDEFPPFLQAVHPVSNVPNWGAMTSPDQWERHYSQLTDADFVPVPPYNMRQLVQPMDALVLPEVRQQNEARITSKLYYSTRYFGRYDLDSGEYEAPHPGIDLKLAHGTPIGSLAGGQVHYVSQDERLGIYIVIEHRIHSEIYFSVYAHMETVAVAKGDSVTPGQYIGTIGMTGNTTAPHVHLQVDKDIGARPHRVYNPLSMPTAEQIDRHSVHPIEFIQQW